MKPSLRTGLGLRPLAALALFVLLGSEARAQFDPNTRGMTWPAGAPRPLPDLDVRLADNGRPAPWVNERNAELRNQASLALRDADIRSLKARIPFLRIDPDEVFGTPRWIASTARSLTDARDGAFDAAGVVREFVAGHRGLLEIAPEELDRARRSRDFRTAHNGIRHLTFQQQIALPGRGPIDLYGAELRANVSRRGELINLSSTMLPRPEGDFVRSPVALTPLQAIRLAALSIGARTTVDPAPAGPSTGANELQAWSATPDFRTDTPVTTELVFFPLTREDIRSAWKVFLPEIGIGNDYDVIVDASDGRILSRRNRLQFLAGGTQDLTLVVYTQDSPGPGSPGNPTPNGYQFPTVTRSVVTITPASVPYSPNSWINDGDNDTQGNNVDAHTDINSDDQPDLPRPTGSPYRVFDFRLDPAQEPFDWRDAAVTNLFYFCNVYHDKLYSLGFDEPAGNFQVDNFGNGGAGNDRVLADCQDGGGFNNANFATPADGQSGRMQMYIFNGPTPRRDGSLDSDIVYHEHTHGVSMRLHGLQLFGVQAGGMGEGWSDYVAISMNADPADDPNAVYCIGGYTTYLLGPGFVDNYYFGIRRFPYSTDLSKNPMTYKDIDPAQQSYPSGVPRNPLIANTANEVHNVGNLWAQILLEARANLWAAYGFAANDRLLQLVVDAMKLDPATPDFLQARDAILQADVNDFGGADLPALWAAFAKRGCGYSARSPSGATSDGVVEAFDLPIVFDYPDGIPTQLLPNQPVTFRVEVSGVPPLQPIPGSGQLFLSVNGGAFQSSPLVQTSQDHYDVTLPAGACFDDLRFYLSTDSNWGPVVNPGGAPADAYEAKVFLGYASRFDDDFQTDKGWVAYIGGPVTSGFWDRGVPVNDPNWAYDPISDADGSGKCYLTGNHFGNSDVDGGAVLLESPLMDLTGGADLTYAYYLYLTDESGGDKLTVKINGSGGSGHWTTIATHATSASTSWRTNTITAAEMANLGVIFTSTMKLRFTANDADPQSVVEAGVDSVHFRVPLCSAPVGTDFCFGDGSGTACPCANSGAAGHGCDNSAATGGAHLTAAGTTIPDTVVLMTTGELPSVLTIFVQGDAIVTDANFGDGLRCVGGTLKRLYVKPASMGQASAPGLADLPITLQSAALGDPIAPGSTRYYFTYYRDPSSTFCAAPAGGTFNASSAFAITW